jgi:hypothetical protein
MRAALFDCFGVSLHALLPLVGMANASIFPSRELLARFGD